MRLEEKTRKQSIMKKFIINTLVKWLFDSKEFKTSLSVEIAKSSKSAASEKITTVKADPSVFTSPCRRFKIRINKCAEKDWIEFHVSDALNNIDGFTFVKAEYPSRKFTMNAVSGSEELLKLVDSLYSTGKCVQMHIHPFKLCFMKPAVYSWDEVIPLVNDAIFAFLTEKYPAPIEEEVTN
jgi:hypothetical protein